MRSGTASGMQIAFFTFATVLLAAPLTQWLARTIPASPEEQALLGRAIPFILATAILFGFPKLRSLCREYLQRSIPIDARLEVVIVTLAKLLLPFALIGAFALWHWTYGGEQALAQYVGAWRSDDKEMARAFQAPQVIHTFMLAGLLGPILEELVFRGLLYRAWERRFGWLAAMLLVSAVFGLYHRQFWSAFASSMIFACLYRRTGSLWAPIIVHSLANISLWYPLLGRHIMPRNPDATSDISQWGLHLTLLAAVAVALPWYVWISRHERSDPNAPAPAATPVHGALPQ